MKMQASSPLLTRSSYREYSYILTRGIVLLTGLSAILLCIGLYSVRNQPITTLTFAPQLEQLGPSGRRPLLYDRSRLVEECQKTYYQQPLDHFNVQAQLLSTTTFQQRVFVYDKYWRRDQKKGPILFYCGNEADVTLYLNHTGFMWENAERLGAVLVFAEHRYYGESHPFNNNNSAVNMQFLSHEQALADYAQVLYHFKLRHQAQDNPVIALGGSYGGMLAAWFRIKYPGVVVGAIAASAPIYAFSSSTRFNGTKYWEIVTRDAEPAAGSSEHCAPNVRRVWKVVEKLARTLNGRQRLAEKFRLCAPIKSPKDVNDLKMFLMMAFDNLAMGNYPYESSYLTNGKGMLPPYPVRHACSFLGKEIDDDDSLLEAMHFATSVYNNATGSLRCYPLAKSVDFDGIWDYQWCSQSLPQESYFDTNGISDMFWDRKITWKAIDNRCQTQWGTKPRRDWITMSYGQDALLGASNIVFSNGLLDPWSAGGVDEATSEHITVLKIPEGAHHLDLFFSHKDDPASVKSVREQELQHIKQWIEAAPGSSEPHFVVQ